MLRRVFVAAFALLVAVGGFSVASRADDVTVFAAASLKDALDAIDTDWQKATGKHATISYAASSALAKQIEAAAPADVFISADLDWMDYLDKKNLIAPGSRQIRQGGDDQARRLGLGVRIGSGGRERACLSAAGGAR